MSGLPEYEHAVLPSNNEVVSGIWQGGIIIGASEDVFDFWENFRYVFTLSPTTHGSLPVPDDGPVEHTWFIQDYLMPDVRTLTNWVTTLNALHHTGSNILVRCQGGLNRSGLVVASMLVQQGRSPEDAITAVRAARGRFALSNRRFEAWLLNESIGAL